MGSARNRNAGISYELDVIKLLREMGYEAVSSRYESKRMDDEGIDIVSNFPFKIQCKCTVNNPNPHDLLTSTAADVIFHRKTEKNGTRFYKVGEYVTLSQEDFLSLVGKAYQTNKT